MEVAIIMADIRYYYDQIVSGKDISFDQALEIAYETDPAVLHEAADMLRRQVHGDQFDLCSIVNLRDGVCTEDCRFCTRSSRYQGEIESYDLVSMDEVLRQARENEQLGVDRFSLITTGREVSLKDIDSFCTMYEELGEQTDLYLCASMGLLTKEKAEKLFASGVRRYHCNLETCRSFYPTICTTQTWDQKAETITIAREAGMDICSGGIIGLGETFEQRLELAFELRELGVLSIPINILTPIPGTPLENSQPLSLYDTLSCIAMFRIINPKAVVRLAGGRAQLGADHYRCFVSGANGAIVGSYQTTTGNKIHEDLQVIKAIRVDHSRPEQE